MMNNARLSGRPSRGLADRRRAPTSRLPPSPRRRVQSKDDGSAEARAGIDHPSIADAPPHADDHARQIPEAMQTLNITPPPASTGAEASWTASRRAAQGSRRPPDPGIVRRGSRISGNETPRSARRSSAAWASSRPAPPTCTRAHPADLRTNGIQARDLRSAWNHQDGSETILGLSGEARTEQPRWRVPRVTIFRRSVMPSPPRCLSRTCGVGSRNRSRAGWSRSAGGRVPFLRLAGTALGSWLLAKARNRQQAKYRDAEAIQLPRGQACDGARFYAEVVLPPAPAQLGPLRPAAPCSALSGARLWIAG